MSFSYAHAVAAVALSLAIAGCSSSRVAGPSATEPEPIFAPRPPSAVMQGEADKMSLFAASFSELPGWANDDHAAAIEPMRKSCGKLTIQSPSKPWKPEGLGVTLGDFRPMCAALGRMGPSPSAAEARAFFERWTQPYLATSEKNPAGLFTGYYEADLRGSPTRSAKYHVPIYRKPSGGAHPSRQAIMNGALRGRGLELMWVDDPIDAFFADIQGSARVTMTDGRMVRINYASGNGHSYFPIGRELIDRGEISREDMSMQKLRAWMEAHPREAPALMALNQSFVFFRLSDADGAVGAQGVTVTPGRSIAVDHRFITYGVPVWLDIDEPKEPGGKLRRLVIAQDTGGAIRGAQRADLFWGAGREAFERAGEMKQPGRWFILVPKKVQG